MSYCTWNRIIRSYVLRVFFFVFSLDFSLIFNHQRFFNAFECFTYKINFNFVNFRHLTHPTEHPHRNDDIFLLIWVDEGKLLCNLFFLLLKLHQPSPFYRKFIVVSQDTQSAKLLRNLWTSFRIFFDLYASSVDFHLNCGESNVILTTAIPWCIHIHKFINILRQYIMV